MGYLANLMGFNTPEGNYPPETDDYWYRDIVAVSSSGRVITSNSAVQQGTVYSCVRILAETISSLPCKLYRREGDGGKQVANDHPLYTTLHDSPNSLMTAMEYWELGIQRLLLRGNFLNRKIRKAGGNRVELDPIFPDDVTDVERFPERIEYTIREPDKEDETLRSGNAFHVRGMTFSRGDAWGHNPIEAMRNSIGLADAAELMGASFLRQGMRPAGAMELEKTLSPIAYQRLKDDLAVNHGGAMNAGKPLILEDGAKWKALSITPEDAQFLETRKFQKEEIASLFRVPMHMLNALDRATFSNIEHQSLEFVVHTLRPWIIRIEQAIKRDLLTQGKFFAEFVVDALLRGDTASRFEAYSSAIQNEWMNKNEVRQRENLNPVDGGDKFRNPAINPQEGASGEGQETEGRGGKVLQAFAEDIGRRMAEAEYDAIRQRAKYADQDREKFNEWAAGFFEDHSKRLDAAIDGFCNAYETRASDRVAMVEAASVEGLKALKTAGNVSGFMEEWQPIRKQAYVQLIKGMVS